MSLEQMNRLCDENYISINENKEPTNRMNNKTVGNNERRVLAPIVAKNNRIDNHLKGKQNGCQQLCNNNQKLWSNISNGITGKTNAEANKSCKTDFGHKSNDFTIFCDQSDSEMNGSIIDNEMNITLDQMDSCQQTDHLLSDCTEISLALEEHIIEPLSEHEVKCEETIMIDTDEEEDNEELEETSISEQTSEVLRSFNLTELISKCKEYENEIHRYLLFCERKHMADPFYMGKQPEINAKMRSVLIDWMVEVTEEYKLLDQTLFLAVNYIDRFLSLMSVSRQSFQLLGTAALFIASKYEEIYPPELSEFVFITDDSYSKQQILNMEKVILKELHFEVSAPTTYYFVDKLASDLALPSIAKHLAKYLCHLTLLEMEPFLRYYPSEVAICCVILSAQTLGFNQIITKEFIDYSISYEKLEKSGDVKNLLAERQSCIEALHKMHAFAHKHSQQAIQLKYANEKYYRVSMVEVMTTSPHIKLD